MTESIEQPFSITAVVIAKNEASLIKTCLQTLQWCSEIIVIDNGSSDETAKIAEAMGAKVVFFQHSSFAHIRNKGLKLASSDWILYLDSDERISPKLAKEISVNIETKTASVFSFQRKNIFYGKHLEYGGWADDNVERVFEVKALEKWSGDIHESPQYQGNAQVLKTPLIHLSHRDTPSGLIKTAQWTGQEAQLLYKANISPVTLLTIFRKGFMEFFRRAILKQGYKDGEVGMIEAVIQGINKALIYIQVWERQQKPSIEETYQEIDQQMNELWQKTLSQKNQI